MPVVLLVVLTSLIGIVLVGAVEAFGRPEQVGSALPAALLCVIPAAVTLHAATWVRRIVPNMVAAVVLVGVGVRLMAAVVGVFVLAPTVKANGGSPAGFAEWVAVFYIVTLAVESGLLIRDAAAVKSPTGSGNSDGSVPTAGR
jgi:hypothetical protein